MNKILPKFIDASGVEYYQQSHVEKGLLGRNMSARYPNLTRRHATAEEMPALTNLGMRLGNQRGKWGITLVKVDEINDILENGPDKYMREKNQNKPLKNSSRSAKSRIVMPAKRSYHAQLNGAVGLKRPPFCSPKLVAQALFSSPSGSLTRREIATWISENYPYYLSIQILSKVSNTLCTCEYFAKRTNSPREWQIVERYVPHLKEYAYLPENAKRRSETRAESATYSSSQLTENPLEDECVASFPVNDAIKTIIESECGEALSETSSTGIKEENALHSRKCVVTLDDVLASPKIIKPEVSDDTHTTEIFVENVIPLKDIKQEVIDFIDLVDDDDDDEIMDESIDATHHSEYKVEPTTVSTTNDSIDLTTSETELILCPICEAEFSSRESLGQHVTSHRTNKAPRDPSQAAKAALQSMTSTLFGGSRNGEAPIFVFSGNVYFNSSTPTS